MVRKKYSSKPSPKIAYINKGQAPKVSGPGNFWKNQKTISALFLIVLVFFSWPAIKNYQKQQALKQQIADAQNEIAKYEDGNENLKQMIGYLESDQAVEEKARLNLGLKKAGEKVVVISNTPDLEASEDAANNLSSAGNPTRWWHYFFH